MLIAYVSTIIIKAFTNLQSLIWGYISIIEKISNIIAYFTRHLL